MTIFLSIAGLVYTIFLSFFFFKKKKIDSIELNIFKTLILTTIFSLVVELLVTLTLVSGYESLGLILMRLFLSSIQIWTTLFIIYVFSISHSEILKNIKNKKSNKIIFALYIFINLIIICVLWFLPIEFYENGSKAYAHGDSINFLFGVSGIYVVAMIILIISDIKNIKKKGYLPVIMLLILLVATAGIQKTNPEMLLINFVYALTIFLMYNTIENPDVKMLNEVSLAKDAAEKANHAKSDFLSNMSHEIRTPLNAIVGFSEALKYDDLPPESVEKVNDIIMASNNLLDIVNGILDISKIEANKLEIISKEYDIHSMLDELVSLTKARIGERSLEFKVNIDKSIPSVLYGDNTRIKQVVLNILTNAVKYTKEGYVDFRVSSVIKNNVCRLIFSVEDSGIGIKEEALPKLFSKFERLNVEKSLTIEGTGLGLAITKKLVELMDGKIIVQSVYGKGSKFTVSVDQRIIAVEKPEVKEVKATESKAINANGARVLVVDDNDLNIKVASTLLKKYNFVIDSAHSGLECINKINKGEQYDIMFLDDMMPKMNGRETIKRLKSNPDYKIPTIALTANAISGMKEEYLSCGFDDYLSKPIEKPELERVIKTYIHKMNDEITNTTSGEASSIIDIDFNIPDVVPRSIQRETEKDNENALDFSNKKLLLVDDNDLNLKVAEMSLRKYKFDITSVKSGSECISKVIENKYDIIFLDDMMPDLDGCKTLDNLKTLEDFNTPVIMMTASPKDEVEKKIQEHGFNDYLGKPFKKEDLDDILNKELNK